MAWCSSIIFSCSPKLGSVWKNCLSIILYWKGKAIPVTDHGGPLGCETSRLPPHFLDDQFTDGSERVSLMQPPPFTPRKIPGTHFCYSLSQPQGHSAAGRIKSIEESNDLIRNQTCDLLACSIVPQPTMIPHAPHCLILSIPMTIKFI
jgi:hypothetical protein